MIAAPSRAELTDGVVTIHRKTRGRQKFCWILLSLMMQKKLPKSLKDVGRERFSHFAGFGQGRLAELTT